jgi:hypothetical protein
MRRPQRHLHDKNKKNRTCDPNVLCTFSNIPSETVSVFVFRTFVRISYLTGSCIGEGLKVTVTGVVRERLWDFENIYIYLYIYVYIYIYIYT